MAQILPEILVSFWSNYLIWYNTQTLYTFTLIYWPLITIDLIRTIGKTVFLPLHIVYKRLTLKDMDNGEFNPKVSIMIPAHNEEKIIERAIETAIETNYPNKEILVIDDGSTDATYKLALPYHRKNQIKLIKRETASGSKAGALNYGVLFATGDIVISVDADTMIERNSISEIISPMRDPDISAVAGNVKIFGGEHGANNLIVKLQQYEYFINLELGRRYASIVGTLLIVSGAFGAFWREMIRGLGTYDPDTITEDFDITFKVKKLGKKIVFSENAVAWTFAPETWNTWRRQRARWTRGQAETMWKHRNLFSKHGFNWNYVIAVYDMLFIDIIVLVVRNLWMVVLAFNYPENMLNITFLMVIIYSIMELYTLIMTCFIVWDFEYLKQVYLIPVMVLIYRPYYSFIRLKAYIDWALKREISW